MKKIFKTELIEKYMKDNGLSKVSFCRLCKIDISVLNKILSNKINFHADALAKIAKGMGIENKDLCTNVKL